MATLYHIVTVYLYLRNWVCAVAGVKVTDALIKDLVEIFTRVRFKARGHKTAEFSIGRLSCQVVTLV